MNKVINERKLFPIIEIIEELSNEQNWKEAEINHIAYYRNIGCDLTNLTDGGDGTLGYIPSLETREKISQSLKNKERTAKQIVSLQKLHENNKGKIRKIPKIKLTKLPRKLTEEQKNNIRNSLIGHHVSEQTKQKIRMANTGKKRPTEAIEMTRAKNTGKQRSEEFCKKQSELKTGKKMSEQTKEKIRMARIGSKLSITTKEKISSAIKKYYENNRSDAILLS